MTSINLISPKNEAHDFTVRFREPITIRKNSKIYLNYAHFLRRNEIVFNRNQTITLSDLEFYPNVQPDDGVNPVALANNTITIPALNPTTKRRAYTVDQLEDIINEKLTEIINANPELFIYTAIKRLDSNRDDNTFLSGFFLDDLTSKLPLVNFIADGTNKRDAGSGDDGTGLECDYFKSSATNATHPHYDSYALGTEKFFHFAGQCMGDKAQMTSGTFLSVKTNVDINAQQGNISFGLYSKEFADQQAAFTGWTEKTAGSGATTIGGSNVNPAIFTSSGQRDLAGMTANDARKARLGSFLTVEITGINNTAALTSQVRILVPARTTDQKNTSVQTWTDIDQDFRKMRQIFKRSLRAISRMDMNEPATFVLVMYVPFTDNNYLDATKRKYYFKLYRSEDDAENDFQPLYDSKQNNIFFPQSFFSGLGNLNIGTADQIDAKVNTQIPFTPIVAAQEQGEGFETVQYRAFPTDQGGADGEDPNAILATYRLNFSDELSNVVGATRSGVLFPNVCEMDARFFYFEDIISSWRNDNFDILLNGLPIRNFKNKEESKDGGFSKALLAAVPVPFLEGNVTEAMGAKHSLLTGLYQPSIKNVLKLRNQEQVINSIGVQVKDSNNETPSEELEQIHVCFTITDEEEE